jgi:hypothetical protein
MLTTSAFHIQELGPVELIGKDDQVDQNDYGASQAITLHTHVTSGEILAFTFHATVEGTGAVQTPAGALLLLDADPAVAAGDTALTAAEHLTILGRVDLAAEDWLADANGAIAYVCTNPVPIHALRTLYAVWRHTDATSFNDAAGDDERLRLNAWYRRDL